MTWALHDTERGVNKFLSSNSSAAEIDVSGTTSHHSITSFNTDGFTTGNDGGYGYTDLNGYGNYVHFTFRKAPGFFDVVTYTGNGANRTIAHNLGSVPGSIWVKKRNSSSDSNWKVWHRGLPNTGTDFLTLNESGAYESNANHWNSTAPTSTHFSLGTNAHLNNSGDTYVAYIFAHDDQSFGDNSDEAIIKCGSFTTDGNGKVPTVDLGFEPQFLILKLTSANSDWFIYDTMRGFHAQGSSPLVNLKANSNGSEATETSDSENVSITSTGFTAGDIYGALNASSTGVYIAIRRPHKPPTAGTDVFAVSAAAGNSDVTTNFPVDLAFQFRRSAGSRAALTRLQGKTTLETRNNSAETLNANAWYQSNTKFLNAGLFTADSAFYLFKRAPGFIDVVAEEITGTSTNIRVNHSLGILPELIFAKRRSGANNWYLYSSSLGRNKFLIPNSTSTPSTIANSWGTSDPTTTDFGWNAFWLGNGSHIYYLFATLAGISKVGTYTGAGSGNSVDVDCGFTAGARFVLIKDTEAAANWYVYDSARGIVSGNDPILFFDTNAAEQTTADDIDPLNAGFKVVSTNSGLNTSGRTYLFLAIA